MKEEIKTDYDYPVKSYIIRVSSDDYDFVCNRNDKTLKHIFSDSYVKFWEVQQLAEMSWFNINGFDILETVHLSNYNKKDQEYLNTLKTKYIEKYNLKPEPDKELSNLLFNNSLDNYRKFYRAQYKEFMNIVKSDDINTFLLYDIAKKLYFDYDYMYILWLRRSEIWNLENIDKIAKNGIIILRDYLTERKFKGMKYPFDKYCNIDNIINEELSKWKDLNSKPPKKKKKKV